MIRFLIPIMLIIFSLPALAQENEKKTVEFVSRDPVDYVSGADYKKMVYDALEMDPHFDFGYFRVLYSSLRSYAPITDNIQREMLTLANTIRNEPLSDSRIEALERYTNLTLQHLANIDVVVMALSLSEEDKKLGNPAFFKWMYQGLLESVLTSGSGAKLMDAFTVVTLGEESALLARLGLKILDTTPAHEGSVYYNMHRVQDVKNMRTYTVFVNTTIPMEFLEKEAQEEKLIPLRPSTNEQIR